MEKEKSDLKLWKKWKEKITRSVYSLRLGYQAIAATEGQLRRARRLPDRHAERKDQDRRDTRKRRQPGKSRRQVQPRRHQGAKQQRRNHPCRDTEHARNTLPRTYPLRRSQSHHRTYFLGEDYEKIRKSLLISILYFDLGTGTDYIYHGQNQFIGVHTGDQLRVNTCERDVLVSASLPKSSPNTS